MSAQMMPGKSSMNFDDMGGFTSSSLYPSIRGLSPQWGLNFNKLLTYIQSDDNNRIKCDPFELINNGQFLTTNDMAIVFTNIPIPITFSVYPKIIGFNPLKHAGATKVRPIIRFDLTADYYKQVVALTADYSIGVAGCKILNGRNVSGVRVSEIYPLDPYGSPSFIATNNYDGNKVWVGPSLKPGDASTNDGVGVVTVTNPHDTAQLHVTLYRDGVPIGSFCIPAIKGLPTAKLIPTQFTLVAETLDIDGNVVSTLDEIDFGAGEAVFLTNLIQGTRSYVLTKCPLAEVFRNCTQRELMNCLYEVQTTPGMVDPAFVYSGAALAA